MLFYRLIRILLPRCWEPYDSNVLGFFQHPMDSPCWVIAFFVGNAAAGTLWIDCFQRLIFPRMPKLMILLSNTKAVLGCFALKDHPGLMCSYTLGAEANRKLL